ncbi:hypothetical protein D5086_016857 [Populus alba]|uniref:Uncharacterized protein n=1 Tax=Populus alba TaxID=43335 RepID=A0ACC4BVV6_POPAL
MRRTSRTSVKKVDSERMFLKVQLPWNVIIPAENLDAKGLMLQRGEILDGIVHKVLKHGVLLRCGPIENIYLSCMKMPDYRYVPGENPVFLNEKTSKIEKDVVVRFVVLGTKWLEAEREFQALIGLTASLLVVYCVVYSCATLLPFVTGIFEFLQLQ